MKKSEQYGVAMCAVIENQRISTLEKLKILETLMADRRMAEMMEERDAERAEAAEGA